MALRNYIRIEVVQAVKKQDSALVREVRAHDVPTWWRDAKLGIFVHWTPASVPAFAPNGEEIGELLGAGRKDALAYSPYTEWYENSLRFPNSPVAKHHKATYGDKPYRDFTKDWEEGLANWDPAEWATRFAATGARYIVFVTKHHDGYCLWPSDVKNPHVPGLFSKRDVVGELADAVRAKGMRFGVYYSGGLDWTFNPHPIGRVSDLAVGQPRGEYVEYADAQVRELIDRYQPSVLWNDISWPGDTVALARLLRDYYKALPDGVVNDRFMPYSRLWAAVKSRPGRLAIDKIALKSAKADKGIVPPKPPLFDVRTPEYATFEHIEKTPWECVRGIDKSFGYNRDSVEADFLTHSDLLWMVIDIASMNGNLLLNVGPRGEDATIADEQIVRLDWLAQFRTTLEAALVGTRPWVVPQSANEGPVEIRYTARDRSVFAFVRGLEQSSQVCLSEVSSTATTVVRDAAGAEIAWKMTDDGLVIDSESRVDPAIPMVIEMVDVTAW